MKYHSTHSDDYLWYLILCGKQKTKKKKTKTPEYKVPLHFSNRRNKKTFVHYTRNLNFEDKARV